MEAASGLSLDGRVRIHMSDSWHLLGTDYRRAAAAFHYIAKNGEAGADAAVVWADSD